MHLSVDDSIHYHPQNKANNFIVELPEYIHLEGEWEVALTDITYLPLFKDRENPKFMIVQCDICDDRIISGKKMPLLQHILIQKNNNDLLKLSITHLIYINVKVKSFNRLGIYIKNETGEDLPFKEEKLWCTLHFRKVSNNGEINSSY